MEATRHSRGGDSSSGPLPMSLPCLYLKGLQTAHVVFNTDAVNPCHTQSSENLRAMRRDFQVLHGRHHHHRHHHHLNSLGPLSRLSPAYGIGLQGKGDDGQVHHEPMFMYAAIRDLFHAQGAHESCVKTSSPVSNAVIRIQIVEGSRPQADWKPDII